MERAVIEDNNQPECSLFWACNKGGFSGGLFFPPCLLGEEVSMIFVIMLSGKPNLEICEETKCQNSRKKRVNFGENVYKNEVGTLGGLPLSGWNLVKPDHPLAHLVKSCEKYTV